MNRIAYLGLGLTTVLLIGGCASGGGAESAGNDDVPEGQVVAAETADPQAVEKAVAFSTPDEASEQARAVVTARCMAAKGFNYELDVASAIDVYESMGQPKITVAQAEESGYPGVPVDSAEGETVAGSGAGEAEQQALLGPEGAGSESATLYGATKSVGAGGCLAQGLKEVYGSVSDGMLATAMAQSSILQATTGVAYDERLHEADESWAACMNSSKFAQLLNPGDAYTTAKQNPSQEHDIALADASCREKTGFDEVMESLVGKYLTTYLTELESEIVEIQHIRNESAARARSILGG